MKRIHPLLLIVLFVLLLVVGLVWKIMDAGECMDQGGLVVAPMTRSQHCASR